MKWTLLWMAVIATRALALTDLDNSLVSEPEIRCNSDTIEMRFRTKHRFTGKIYVQGHFHDPDCRVDYSQTDTNGVPIGGIRLQHGACDMDRQRLISAGSMGMVFI
jgi:polyisoprenoid-binding protein YceI